jgi:hypothetical protein
MFIARLRFIMELHESINSDLVAVLATGTIYDPAPAKQGQIEKEIFDNNRLGWPGFTS